GLFQIESGKVKLSVSSSNGRTAIVKIAQPGEFLGVIETLVNSPYLATAEVVERSDIIFTSRTHLQGRSPRGELTARLVTQLGAECLRMFREVSAYRLSSTASQRLAQLLLELLANELKLRRTAVINMPYTHAEIGQLIGSSRETVTRLLKHFQKSMLIDISRSKIYVMQIEKLRKIALV